jgi:hypothetical protein
MELRMVTTRRYFPTWSCAWSRRGEAGHKEPATLDTGIVEVASASRGWPWKAAGCCN